MQYTPPLCEVLLFSTDAIMQDSKEQLDENALAIDRLASIFDL